MCIISSSVYILYRMFVHYYRMHTIGNIMSSLPCMTVISWHACVQGYSSIMCIQRARISIDKIVIVQRSMATTSICCAISVIIMMTFILWNVYKLGCSTSMCTKSTESQLIR